MNRQSFLRNANLAAVSLVAGGGLLGCMKRTVGAAVAAGALPVNLLESACHLLRVSAPPERAPGSVVAGALLVNLPATACQLDRVSVSPEREIRSVVGLRPCRPSGFRVAKVMVGETAVVHNYGIGGGGITLSWGTSKLAVDLGLPG